MTVMGTVDASCTPARYSAAPSVEALSTTIHSHEPGRVNRNSARRHIRVNSS
jgi:hypothetical protein